MTIMSIESDQIVVIYIVFESEWYKISSYGVAHLQNGLIERPKLRLKRLRPQRKGNGGDQNEKEKVWEYRILIKLLREIRLLRKL